MMNSPVEVSVLRECLATSAAAARDWPSNAQLVRTHTNPHPQPLSRKGKRSWKLVVRRLGPRGSKRVSASQQNVAIVTGSGRKRIGWHVARALGDRGYSVVIHYQSSAAEAAEAV